jgi:hypothetical protein
MYHFKLVYLFSVESAARSEVSHGFIKSIASIKEFSMEKSHLNNDSFSKNETLDIAEAYNIESDLKTQDEKETNNEINEDEVIENELVEDEVISETNAEQPEIVAENPILETFEAIEEDNETTEVPSNEKEATQNVDENGEVLDEGIEEQLKSNTPTEALDRSEVENKNEADSNETQMLNIMELTQIASENTESISLAFDSTIIQNTQLLRDDSQEDEEKVENEVTEEVAVEKVQDTLQAQSNHGNVEDKESETLAIDVDEPAQIDEIITEPVPEETEPPSNDETPQTDPIQPQDETPQTDEPQDETSKTAEPQDETSKTAEETPAQEENNVPEHMEEDEDQRAPIVEEPCVKKHAYVTTPGNVEPETPRSRKNRINYAALASGSKATPKRQTPLKTQTPARSARKLKLQPQETEAQAPIEEEVVRVEIEASLETITEPETIPEVTEESVETEIVSEVVEERIEEPSTAEVRDQDPMLEVDDKLQKEPVADDQVEEKPEEKVQETTNKEEYEPEPEPVEELIPTPIKVQQVTEGTPSSRRGVNRPNYATLNSGLTPKRARITPDRVDTPVNKPKRGRKVVTIVEEPEQDPKDEEKTSKKRGPKPFEKKESTEKVTESEMETEEVPKEEAKPSRKRGPKAASKTTSKEVDIPISPEVKSSRRRGQTKPETEKESIPETIQAEAEPEQLKKRGRQVQKKAEPEPTVSEIPTKRRRLSNETIQVVEAVEVVEETSKPGRRGRKVAEPKVEEKVEIPPPKRGGRGAKEAVEEVPQEPTDEVEEKKAPTRGRKKKIDQESVSESTEVLNTSSESIISTFSARSRRAGRPAAKKQDNIEEDLNESIESAKSATSARSRRGRKAMETVEEIEEPKKVQRGAKKLEEAENKVEEKPVRGRRKVEKQDEVEEIPKSIPEPATSKRGKKEVVVEEVKETRTKRGAKKDETKEGK